MRFGNEIRGFARNTQNQPYIDEIKAQSYIYTQHSFIRPIIYLHNAYDFQNRTFIFEHRIRRARLCTPGISFVRATRRAVHFRN